MIEEQYVSRDTARMLKEVGFDEVCSWAYDETENTCVMHERNSMLSPGYISRPTQALAARWIREVHKLHVFAKRSCDYSLLEHRWSYWIQNAEYDVYKDVEIGFSSYEEAFEAGLQEAVKLIKK